MAIRQIRIRGDEILRKKCKEVKAVTDRTKQLIEDLFDTMYDDDGVGLAAPQVGILKRIAVIDVTEDRSDPIVLINPVILEKKGKQRGTEGCLSVPDMVGIVSRPNYVKVEAYDENMNKFVVEGEELLARALIHEIEHLDGELYVDKVEGKLYTLEEFAEEFGEG